ncbi:hypothetical protein AB0J86_11460 [Micromonospora sp. NPDC049559]|uniref:hypothetical protein n=1 Tax=Micromonospora sp. NPDC049559 TaxID=3155923 RepID=UPI003443AFE9
MDPARADRLRGVVLAFGALAVLVAGGAWWVAADPAVPARLAAPDSAPDAAPLYGAGADGLPGPAAGQAVTLDVATGAVLQSGPALQLRGLLVESALPRAPRTLRRELLPLDQGRSASWRVSAGWGQRYRLQYACAGPAGARLRVYSGRLEQTWSRRCDGTRLDVTVTAWGDLLIQVERDPGPPVMVGFQLLGRPRNGSGSVGPPR